MDKLSNEIKKAEHGLENYIPKTQNSVEERELYYKEGFFVHEEVVLEKLRTTPPLQLKDKKFQDMIQYRNKKTLYH